MYIKEIGLEYEGDWVNDYQQGYASISINGNKIYNGTYVLDPFEGIGTSYNNGRIKIILNKDNLEGYMLLSDKKGILRVNHTMLRGKCQDKVIIYDENGIKYYEGQIILKDSLEGNYILNGKGILYYDNGNFNYIGNFKNNYFDGFRLI